MNWYEERQEARRERLENAAARAGEEADRRHDAAMEAIKGIEPGQPILVGHHSERHHRRALERCNTNMRKAIDAGKAQRELAHAAEAVGTGGVSSDDPDAPDKLQRKLEELERVREQWKAINVAFRKRDAATIQRLTNKTLEAWDEHIAAAYSWERQPVPRWKRTNLGARIRQVKQRLAMLEKVAAIPAREQTIGAIRIVELTDEDNRVALYFPKEMLTFRQAIKRAGWRWSPTRTAWVRQRGPSTFDYAVQLATQEAQ